MTRGSKISALAAAAISAIVSSRAHATFTYSLQFSPTGNPAGATVSGDAKTATLASGATGLYTLQLWGIITDSTTYANDGVWTQGAVSIGSSSGGVGHAIATGGVTGAALGAEFAPTPVRLGVQNEFSGDTITDWGSNLASPSSNGTKWLYWQDNNAATLGVGGFQPNGTTIQGQSQPVPGDPKSWEVLVATFTVNIATMTPQDSSDHQTIFSVMPIPGANGLSVTTTGHGNGLGFYQDGNATQLNAGSVGTGVTFDLPASTNIPEPASLGVLALGGLALVARRKRAR